MAHDFVNFPELRDDQLDFYYWESPHRQIFEDFSATCVKVHDGDTITLRWQERDFDFPLRFAEINANELSEGGEEARDFLKSLIENEEVDITIDRNNRVDKWGRLLGKVSHSGIDLGELLINEGHAQSFDQRNEGKIPNINKTLDLQQWQI